MCVYVYLCVRIALYIHLISTLCVGRFTFYERTFSISENICLAHLYFHLHMYMQKCICTEFLFAVGINKIAYHLKLIKQHKKHPSIFHLPERTGSDP